MIAYIGRRLLIAVPTLIGVSVVLFFTIKLVPGDPVLTLLGPLSTPEQRAELTERLGLDQPALIQYFTWFGNLLTGDLGTSINRHVAVAPLVLDALVNTLILSGLAAVVAIVVGTLLGAVMALRPQSLLAKAANALALVALAAPQYAIGLIFIIVFSVVLGVLPSGGMYSAVGDRGIGDLLAHAILPVTTAALVPMGIIARMVRSSISDVMSMDFIESLHARGFSRGRVLTHAFHNTVPSLVTVIGLQVGYLLGGVMFVEAVFSWPGVGLLVYQSISQRDLPVIQAGVLVSALLFVVINLIVDVVQGAVDPRVRANS